MDELGKRLALVDLVRAPWVSSGVVQAACVRPLELAHPPPGALALPLPHACPAPVADATVLELEHAPPIEFPSELVFQLTQFA